MATGIKIRAYQDLLGNTVRVQSLQRSVTGASFTDTIIATGGPLLGILITQAGFIGAGSDSGQLAIINGTQPVSGNTSNNLLLWSNIYIAAFAANISVYTPFYGMQIEPGQLISIYTSISTGSLINTVNFYWG